MSEDIRVVVPNPVFKGTLNITAAWTSIIRSLCEQNGLVARDIVVRKRTPEEMQAIEKQKGATA